MNLAFQNIFMKVHRPFEYLNDDMMNYFILMVRHSPKIDYDMQNTQLTQRLDDYGICNDKDNIQIFFNPPPKIKIQTKINVGHWSTICYKHNKREVFVYDSLYCS